MKKLMLAAASALIAAAPTYALDNTVAPKVTEPGAAKPAVALLVGNSYSFYNCGVHGYLRGLNKASMPDLKWKMRQVTITSAPLSLHPVEQYLGAHEDEPYSADKKSGTPKFDVVILQPLSTAATNDKKTPSFEKYAKKHAETIRKAGSVPVLVMTWARQDKPEQIKKLADTVTRVGNENNMQVVPVGLAFSEALKGKPELALHQKDKSHPTAAGSYLYGAVLQAALFKKSPVGNSFLGECEKPLSPELAKYLQEVAWKTVTQYYGWK